MKTFISGTIAAILISLTTQAWSQAANYTNFIRQTQYPTGLVRDSSVANSGQQLSTLPIDPGGAKFELWTVNSTGPTSYLLSSSYVGTYIPMAVLAIRSEDTTSDVLRTRADRPFYVDLSIQGLHNGATDPDASKAVNFYWHVQSYGAKGTGVNIDTTQATLKSTTKIDQNGSQTLTFAMTSIPSTGSLTKVRGEERFSVYSLQDNNMTPAVPPNKLASQTIQIWPVADGSITGITSGQTVRYQLPQLTFTLNDLYPNSTTYAQAYPGNAALNTEGKIINGSALALDESVPQDRVLVVSDYADALGADGIWTIELITKTPFGIERLAYVTFNLDRTMKVNGTFTTIE